MDTGIVLNSAESSAFGHRVGHNSPNRDIYIDGVRLGMHIRRTGWLSGP